VPILVFLGLSVLELGPMYATDRRQTKAALIIMPPPYGGGGIIINAATFQHPVEGVVRYLLCLCVHLLTECEQQ